MTRSEAFERLKRYWPRRCLMVSWNVKRKAERRYVVQSFHEKGLVACRRLRFPRSLRLFDQLRATSLLSMSHRNGTCESGTFCVASFALFLCARISNLKYYFTIISPNFLLQLFINYEICKFADICLQVFGQIIAQILFLLLYNNM